MSMTNRAVRATSVSVPAPYRSTACHIGTHHECHEFTVPVPPPEHGVRREPCVCLCHTPSTPHPPTDSNRHLDHQGDAVHTPRRFAVSTIDVTSRTLQPGDVLTICGHPYEVLNLIELPCQGKALRFTTGEVLSVHSRTRLSVQRAVREW